jgi:hypothetical protein
MPSKTASGLRSDMFAEDGCVKPNIPTRPYRVILAPKCEHTHILGAAIDVRGTSAEEAKSYVEKWLNIPQNHVHRVYEITPDSVIGPKE